MARAYDFNTTANTVANDLTSEISGKVVLTTGVSPGDKVDKFLGNHEGWKEDFNFKSSQQGVATHIYAAFEPGLHSHNAAYLLDSHVADPMNPDETVKSWATSPIEAEMLWKLSEKLVDQSFSY